MYKLIGKNGEIYFETDVGNQEEVLFETEEEAAMELKKLEDILFPGVFKIVACCDGCKSSDVELDSHNGYLFCDDCFEHFPISILDVIDENF